MEMAPPPNVAISVSLSVLLLVAVHRRDQRIQR
jgi:hypothetical protein